MPFQDMICATCHKTQTRAHNARTCRLEGCMGRLHKYERHGVLKMAINGHVLTGEQRGGQWAIRCESFPDLADAVRKGRLSLADLVEQFTTKALCQSL